MSFKEYRMKDIDMIIELEEIIEDLLESIENDEEEEEDMLQKRLTF